MEAKNGGFQRPISICIVTNVPVLSKVSRCILARSVGLETSDLSPRVRVDGVQPTIERTKVG